MIKDKFSFSPDKKVQKGDVSMKFIKMNLDGQLESGSEITAIGYPTTKFEDKINFLFTGANSFFVRNGVFYIAGMAGFTTNISNQTSGDSYVFEYDEKATNCKKYFSSK